MVIAAVFVDRNVNDVLMVKGWSLTFLGAALLLHYQENMKTYEKQLLCRELVKGRRFETVH